MKHVLILFSLLCFSNLTYGADAGAYFVNQTFTDEYLAVLAKTRSKNPEKLFKDKSNLNLWLRASYGFLSAAKLQTPLAQQDLLRDTLLAHAKILKKMQTKQSKLVDEFIKNQTSSALALKFEPLVADTFQPVQKTLWAKMLIHLKSTPPDCTGEQENINSFAKKSGQVKMVQTWPPEKLANFIHCLKIAARTPEEAEKLSPLNMLDKLRQFSSPLYQDKDVQLFHALSLYQSHQFAESLRLLVPLQETSPEYRLICEMVQRVFSLSQQGKGEVALRQSL